MCNDSTLLQCAEGDFFVTREDFGERSLMIYSQPMLFSVEISFTPIPSFKPCVCACFPEKFPHECLDSSQPTPTSLGQGVCSFRCNLPPAFPAEWLASFKRYCGNVGSQHRKLTLERKILQLLLLGLENLQPSDHKSDTLPTELSCQISRPHLSDPRHLRKPRTNTKAWDPE